MVKGGDPRRRDASRRRRPEEQARRKTAGERGAPRPAATGAKGEPTADASGAAADPFVLGVIPGATPGKWVDAWNERMPGPLDLRAIAVATQREELIGSGLDAALVRLPLEGDGLHVIPLYDELSVVVVPSDSHLTAADDLEIADLAGEIVIVPGDDVLAAVIPDAVTPAFDMPATTEDAIATVAAGIGVVIVPMSLARAHARRDMASRPLRNGPTSTVALAWVADRTTPSVEAFVGIVRGRTANSSRS